MKTSDAETLHRLAEFGRAVLVTLEREDQWDADTLAIIASDAECFTNRGQMFALSDPASLDRAVALAAKLATREG